MHGTIQVLEKLVRGADEYKGPTMYLCNHICGVMDWRLDRSAQCLLVGKR